MSDVDVGRPLTDTPPKTPEDKFPRLDTFPWEKIPVDFEPPTHGRPAPPVTVVRGTVIDYTVEIHGPSESWLPLFRVNIQPLPDASGTPVASMELVLRNKLVTFDKSGSTYFSVTYGSVVQGMIATIKDALLTGKQVEVRWYPISYETFPTDAKLIQSVRIFA